jgi:1-hydroxycarotenoid 3,4-desaturase
MVLQGNASRVVVIGAGVGGLVAAAQLAAKGLSVTLLERAATPGGKMRTVRFGDAEVDAGPTVLTMRWVLDAVFADVGRDLRDYLTLRPSDLLARHVWPDGSRLDLFADVHRTTEAVRAFAGPREADGYRAYAAYCEGIFRAVEHTFLHAQRPTLGSVLRDQGLRGIASLTRIDGTRTMWRALGDFFRDPRLLQLFGRYATYAGSSPWKCPATLNVIAHVERVGVWLPEGGMVSVARALARLNTELGVDLRCDTEVRELVLSRGRVAGVRLDSGEVVPADAVVFNGDAGALAQGLLGDGARGAWKPVVEGERSLSAMTTSAVARTAGVSLTRHTVFFSQDYAREFADITERESLPDDPTVYVCAQDRDDQGRLPNDGPERLFLIVNAPARGGVRPFSTEELHRCTQRTREKLTRMGLSVEWEPPRTVTTSPDDFARMFPGTRGALYGPASHGMTSPLSRAGARTTIPGLYLCGGSAHPGAGVPMAAQSGRLAARTALEDLASTGRSRATATPGGTSTP